MNVVHKIESWGDTHHPKILDIVRIALGILLFLKGLAFMENTAYLKQLIEDQGELAVSSGWLMALVYYVTFAHMVGGTLIAFGIFTRSASIIQIPIVFGAVFFINMFNSTVNSELSLSVAALILLAIFAILGSGPISLDKYLSDIAKDTV